MANGPGGRAAAALALAAALVSVSGLAAAQEGPAGKDAPVLHTVPAVRETGQVPVPVEQAAYHVPVLRNEYGILLRVYIPPGRDTDYHTHTLSQISVIIEPYPPEAFSQPLGEDRGVVRGADVGDTFYRAYAPPPQHRAVNPGRLPMHFLALALTDPAPRGFNPLPRPEAQGGFGYTQEFDLPNARAWRLQLKPGETAPPITQTAPGFRVVVNNDAEIAELEPGRRDRPIYLRKGDFYWQEPGQTRGVRNIGTTPLYLVEIELK